MVGRRLTLDSEVFSGKLRYERRPVSYSQRPVHRSTIQDIVAVKQSAKPIYNSLSVHKVPKPSHYTQNPKIDQTIPRPTNRAGHVSQSNGVTDDSTNLTTVIRGKTQKPRHNIGVPQILMYAAVILLLVGGGAVSFSGWHKNKQVAVEIKKLQQQTARENTDVLGSTTAVPSTEKPSPDTVRNYAVAPTLPRYMSIPSLGVHGRVLSMTVDKNNELQSPYGIWDVGWYSGSSKPGDAGAMLVDAHSGIGKTHGIFHDINKLIEGDKVEITRGDGTKYAYLVAKVEIIDADKINMASLLVSKDPNKPGLNLITCYGDQVPGTFSLKQRVLVYTVLQ